MSYTYIHPKTFAEKLVDWSETDGVIIDVRESYEWDYYHLEQSQLIPMNTIPYKLEVLPQDTPLYIICAHGVRSETVSHYLAEQGFDKVINVSGGMAAVAELRGFAYD
ncbi:MAG: sulfurtransferase [Paenibacillus sp.]|jgi:rhodanese-related sulfurtransferase|nr:sulfurtransferase [Paenibacillus sp.]